jgi:hypothetical protein
MSSIWDKTIWRTLNFFAIFDIQTSEVSKYSNVLKFFLIFFHAEFHQKRYRKNKNLAHVTKKAMKCRHAIELMPSSLHLKFVEQNFVLTKVQATYSY